MSESNSSRHPDGQPTEAQPRWRQDFPVDVEQDEYISRRDFAKFLVLTSGAMVVGHACLVGQSVARQSRDPLEPLAIIKESELAAGQVVSFNYPGHGDPCLLAKIDEGKLLAYGQKCTHLSCAVTPDLSEGKFACPCHNGSFDMLTGRPLAGPPRRPLPRITLEVKNGTIYATGVELST